MTSPGSPSAASSTGGTSTHSHPNSPSPSMLSTSAHSSHTGATSPAGSPASQSQQTQSASAAGGAAGAQSASASASASGKDKVKDILCKWAGCSLTFDNADVLYTHLCDDHVGRKSTNNLCLTCHWDDCDATCAKRDHITSHLRVHIPLKPHLCPICSKSFKRPQDLKKHERIHPPQIGHPAFAHQFAGQMAYHMHPHQYPHHGMHPSAAAASHAAAAAAAAAVNGQYPGTQHAAYPAMPAPTGAYPSTAHFFHPGAMPSAAPGAPQFYQPGQHMPSYPNMYAPQQHDHMQHGQQPIYDPNVASATYAGLSGNGRKRSHDQVAAVEDFLGQVANKRIAPTYDGAMINRLNDTLANFIENRATHDQTHQPSNPDGFPVSQFVGLGVGGVGQQPMPSNNVPITTALHPNAQAHQAQLQAAVAGAMPTSNADLADFNAWLVQLGTEIARGTVAAAATAGQRHASQPSLNLVDPSNHQQNAQHFRSHSHGAIEPPSGTFDFVASLTQANLTQIPGVDSSLFAQTFTPGSGGNESNGSLSVGGHSPASLSASARGSHHGMPAIGMGHNESPFSFDALVANRTIAQLPQRALDSSSADSPVGSAGAPSPGDRFNTSFNSLAQPRNMLPNDGRSDSGPQHIGSAATIPQLAPHFGTSLNNSGFSAAGSGVNMGADGNMYNGQGFPPTAYRRVEPLMRAAPQPGEALYEYASARHSRSAVRKMSGAEDDNNRAASPSSSSSSSSSSRSRSRSGTPTSASVAGPSSSSSSPPSRSFAPLYPRILSSSEMPKRTLPPPTISRTSSSGQPGDKLPSISAILAERDVDSDEELAKDRRQSVARIGGLEQYSSTAVPSINGSSRSAQPASRTTQASSAAAPTLAEVDAETRAAHLQLIIQLLKALNSGPAPQVQNWSDSESIASHSMEDAEDDDDDDERPMAQQSQYVRRRTAEEECAAQVLDGLRLARPSTAASRDANDAEMEFDDGQRTPRMGSPVSYSSTTATGSGPSSSTSPQAPPRRVQGLKDLLNDVGVEPMRRQQQPPAVTSGMDLD
ncbi:unnamed protein product [Tilletia controversa]|uniref:C2H2-type domain-containing protein n=4 Tax=Tilletia TaxID=13289 RepID=A0A8X7MT20_9BASI|nr:hypothetical protein CF328_g4110 [Tilletia controversa]KAE8196774.1 hypothetical protein CF336_g2468 [Tilletia laevis]KAE8262874.1 hypothetical protein A4X03_0g2109 [Tilletia caries]KAE8246884.1 hypothetical protein A4X06_0g4840 [Tilletia controversa]CAD6885280.1 unnamed protein product [Tilletia caries]